MDRGHRPLLTGPRRPGLRRAHRSQLPGPAASPGTRPAGRGQRRVRLRRRAYAGEVAGRAAPGVDGVRGYGPGARARDAADRRRHRYPGLAGTRLRRPALGTGTARDGGERDMSAIQSRKVVGPLAKLLVFAAITLVLTGLLANTLGPLWTDDGTEYRARFTDVTGVLPGDDVRIAGVRVGQVTGVKVAENTLAELTFTVDRQVRLAPSAHATIRC